MSEGKVDDRISDDCREIPGGQPDVVDEVSLESGNSESTPLGQNGSSEVVEVDIHEEVLESDVCGDSEGIGSRESSGSCLELTTNSVHGADSARESKFSEKDSSNPEISEKNDLNSSKSPSGNTTTISTDFRSFFSRIGSGISNSKETNSESGSNINLKNSSTDKESKSSNFGPQIAASTHAAFGAISGLFSGMKSKSDSFIQSKTTNNSKTESSKNIESAVKLKLSGGQTNTSLLKVSEFPLEIPGVFNWYRLKDSGELMLLENVKGPEYMPSIDDVGSRICVQWIPDSQFEASPSAFADVPAVQLELSVQARALKISQSHVSECVESISIVNEDSTVELSNSSSHRIIGNQLILKGVQMDKERDFLCGVVEISATFESKDTDQCESLSTRSIISFSRFGRVLLDPSKDLILFFETGLEQQQTLKICCNSHDQRDSVALAFRMLLKSLQDSAGNNSIGSSFLDCVNLLKKEFESIQDGEVKKTIDGELLKLEKIGTENFEKANSLHNEIQQLRMKIDSIQQENALQHEEICNLRRVNSDLQQKCQLYLCENQSILDSLASVESLKQELANHLENEKRSAENLKQQLNHAKRENSHTEDQFRRRIEGLIAEKNSSVEEISSLKQKLSENSIALRKFDASKKNLESQNSAYKLSEAKYLEDLSTYRDINETLKVDVGRLSEQIVSLTENNEELLSENNSMKIKLEEFEEDVVCMRESSEKLKRLKLENEDLAEKYGVVKADRDRIREEVSNLEQKLIDLSGEESSLGQELIHFKRLSSSLTEELKAKDAELERFRQIPIIDSSENIVAEIPAFVHDDSRYKNMEDELSNLSNELIHLQEKNKALVDELESKMNLEEKTNADFDILKKQLQMVVEERDQLASERNAWKNKTISLSKDFEKLVRSSPSQEEPISQTLKIEIASLKKQLCEANKLVSVYQEAFQQQVSKSSFHPLSAESVSSKRYIDLELLVKRLSESLSEANEEISRFKDVNRVLQARVIDLENHSKAFI